jgi:hypothetical protein
MAGRGALYYRDMKDVDSSRLLALKVNIFNKL